jgi:hypothetical protein
MIQSNNLPESIGAIMANQARMPAAMPDMNRFAM